LIRLAFFKGCDEFRPAPLRLLDGGLEVRIIFWIDVTGTKGFWSKTSSG